MDKKHSTMKRQFLKMLSNTGHSLIDEQKQILDIFCDNERHITINDVEQQLQKAHKEIPHQFIRATLDMFCQYGIAEKLTFRDGNEYYEHKHLQEHHDHMICVKCGNVVEFVVEEIEKLQSAAATREKFHPLWHTLEIYGLCKDCFTKSYKTFPLAFSPLNQELKVVSIVGGYSTRKRLADMGLVPEAKIIVLNNNGPFILAIKGSRIAVGLGIARKIVVTPAEIDDSEKKKDTKLGSDKGEEDE